MIGLANVIYFVFMRLHFSKSKLIDKRSLLNINKELEMEKYLKDVEKNNQLESTLFTSDEPMLTYGKEIWKLMDIPSQSFIDYDIDEYDDELVEALSKLSKNPRKEVVWEEPVIKSTNCWMVTMLSGTITNYSPSCNLHGKYTPKQCFLERCWCVTSLGQPIKKIMDENGDTNWKILEWSDGIDSGIDDSFFTYGVKAIKLNCDSILTEYKINYLTNMKKDINMFLAGNSHETINRFNGVTTRTTEDENILTEGFNYDYTNELTTERIEEPNLHNLEEHNNTLHNLEYNLVEHNNTLHNLEYNLEEHNNTLHNLEYNLEEHNNNLHNLEYNPEEHNNTLNIHHLINSTTETDTYTEEMENETTTIDFSGIYEENQTGNDAISSDNINIILLNGTLRDKNMTTDILFEASTADDYSNEIYKKSSADNFNYTESTEHENSLIFTTIDLPDEGENKTNGIINTTAGNYPLNVDSAVGSTRNRTKEFDYLQNSPESDIFSSETKPSEIEDELFLDINLSTSTFDESSKEARIDLTPMVINSTTTDDNEFTTMQTNDNTIIDVVITINNLSNHISSDPKISTQTETPSTGNYKIKFMKLNKHSKDLKVG